MRFSSGGHVAHDVLIYVADVLTGHCGRSWRERLSWAEGAARMYLTLITTSNWTRLSRPMKSNICFLAFVWTLGCPGPHGQTRHHRPKGKLLPMVSRHNCSVFPVVIKICWQGIIGDPGPFGRDGDPGIEVKYSHGELHHQWSCIPLLFLFLSGLSRTSRPQGQGRPKWNEGKSADLLGLWRNFRHLSHYQLISFSLYGSFKGRERAPRAPRRNGSPRTDCKS